MSIKAQIIADSINPRGCRLTTFILEYPRFIHAEVATHRVFSKNAASSRAIPIEKMIKQVEDDPAMPVWWGKNQSGMQAKEELSDEPSIEIRYNRVDGEIISPREAAKRTWLWARKSSVRMAQDLSRLGLHKQVVNRVLEPWFNIRIILSGTEFENFFALRAHPDAQPEIQALAYMMLDAYNASEPRSLKPGEWHVPFGGQIDEARVWDIVNADEAPIGNDPAEVYYGTNHRAFEEAKRQIAIARCARISFLNYEGKDDYAADIVLCNRLFGSTPRHLSPTEHVAQCMDDDTFVANYRGFKQYRYVHFAEDQNLSDPRVIKKVYNAQS